MWLLIPKTRSEVSTAMQVLATLRRELFRTLLLQRIDFFDRHDPAELTALISNELDSLRSLVFKCACWQSLWQWQCSAPYRFCTGKQE